MMESRRIVDRPPRDWVLAVLCLVYLGAGLVGHDPWKNDDAVNFGVIYGFLAGHDWLVPHLAGEPWLESPPLYHWIGALVALASQWLLPLPDAARLATGLFAAVFLIALAGAGRALHGQNAGAAATLVAIGCLGLLGPLHETQPAAAVLAASALSYWGLAILPRHYRSGGKLLGIGIGAAFLVSGLDAIVALLPVALLAMLAPRWRSDESRRGFARALLIAATLAALWPALLAWQAPAALSGWWARELASLQPSGSSSFADHLQLLAWFAWPALPLALWALWRHRHHAGEAAIALPLAGTVLNLALLLGFHDARPIHALSLLVPLILLATAGAGTLRRGAANAFDWFAMMTFTLVGFLVWLGGIAMVTGIPAQIQHNFLKLEPGFVGRFAPLPWALAALLSLLWLWRIWRSPRSPWRAISHWAGGVTLMWSLLAALWYPWIDYGKSYRGVASDLQATLRGNAGCIAGDKLSDAVRASLHYFAGVITVSTAQPAALLCNLRLEQGSADREAAPDGWRPIWEGHRPGDRNERLRLFRREATVRPS